MNHELLVERFFETLINGDRDAARAVVDDTLRGKMTPKEIITDLFWPTYQLIDRLFRTDKLTDLSYHLASRLLRVLVDQLGPRLERAKRNGRTIFACCGPTQCEELAAQLAVDLLEADGFAVTFAGGGVPSDEILSQAQEMRPDILLMFASAASDLPGIRSLIDTIREIGACAKTQVVVGAGVFNRAEGLAEEVGADLWATDPLELVEVINANPERRATQAQRTVGKTRNARYAA